MVNQVQESQYDVILVGSGTCNATIAKELSKTNKRVLVIEEGADVPLKNSFKGIASVAKEFKLNKKVKALSGITAGGATSLYFGVCKYPTEQALNNMGIDLTAEYEEAKKELPITQLSDDYLANQSLLFRESASQLGYSVKKNDMFIDQSKCETPTYHYEALWKAKSFLLEALNHGVEIITKAKVEKIITENGMAIGVEYKPTKGSLSRVFADKVVIGAGSFSTPALLKSSGIHDVGNKGFFCKPGFMVCGTVPKLNGGEGFLGCLDIDLGNGVSVGDGTMNASLFRMVMLANLKISKLFSHAKMFSVGILLNDEVSGIVDEKGRFNKVFTQSDLEKLKGAGEVAEKIVRNAGAKNIFRTNLVASNPGALLKVGEHLNTNLETKIKNLYVCDSSLISDVNSTPTLTLVSLGKYLAKRLFKTSEAQPEFA
ncbi:GMC family oxidoreductase N-terminal domain-containing protein [Teredinibacter sp. KSP-S5-2]|uniref:GMC family oxidoreductase N-terminal domain-containing protein n=1 Tax=Teredinibacter sp. KSP-S5-2 TaxID=3034506 RepID=UPI002934DDDB|nr:GMC family oxidoreductase N-terminal domain-containing protein [Teredinibacter sp. KSP-S5-2]WNO11565.1 GMC family oxidoreductase N-terminal domain-containing protein [Teredinibacter sp. KSP-S5-2]